VLVEESDGNYIFYNYHYEDWFYHGGDDSFDSNAQSNYQLYSKYDLSKVNTQKKKIILYDIVKCLKNDKLIKYYEDLKVESVCLS
jgi:hypothetical protein